MTQPTTRNTNGLTIRTAPGALDEVPFKRLFRFLKENRLTIEPREDGLYIVSASSPILTPHAARVAEHLNGNTTEV